MKETLFGLGLLMFATALMAQPQEPTAKKIDELPPYDSTKALSLLFAAEAGGGWNPGLPNAPTAHAGIKLGTGGLTLDLNYDRISGRSGFSTEGSVMLPLFRYPGPSKDDSKNFIRVYAEPGLGYRAGGGPFGQYSSAKVMVVLFSNKRLGLDNGSPYVEFQRRFSFNSPLHGDNRVTVGIMVALCSSCGVE
jgi:hypothetical protein